MEFLYANRSRDLIDFPMSNQKEVLMMQDYDFIQDFETKSASTNTSVESVSICCPSQRVIRNIKAYARCVQQVKIGDVKIKLYLN